MSEPDARKRRMAIIDYTTRSLRRLPTVEEVLEFIQANGLYSAPWENPRRWQDIKNIWPFGHKLLIRQSSGQRRLLITCLMSSPDREAQAMGEGELFEGMA